jgi:hypothetical protein
VPNHPHSYPGDYNQSRDLSQGFLPIRRLLTCSNFIYCTVLMTIYYSEDQKILFVFLICLPEANKRQDKVGIKGQNHKIIKRKNGK